VNDGVLPATNEAIKARAGPIIHLQLPRVSSVGGLLPSIACLGLQSQSLREPTKISDDANGVGLGCTAHLKIR